MKAAIYTRYGGPDVVRIEEIPRPVPKDNEALVRVHATTVCAADWRPRKADHPLVRAYGGWLRPRKPVIAGMEFSGVVVEVGAKMKRFKVGDEIFGNPGMFSGGHAEYVCVPEMSWTATRPPNVSLEDSTALFFGGLTALTFFKRAGIARGQNVLIYGASGAVGVAAVQLAKHIGARVTAVCGPNNLALVKSLGADAAIDYTREDFSKDGRIYDAVIECVGKAKTAPCLRALKPGGALVLISGPLFPTPARLIASLTGAVKVVGAFPPEMPTAEHIRELWKIANAGALKTVIGKRFTFDQIVEAHAYAESGHKVGNALVIVDGAAHA